MASLNHNRYLNSYRNSLVVILFLYSSVFLFDKSNAKTRHAKEHRSIHQDGDRVLFGPIDDKVPRKSIRTGGTPFSRSLMGPFLERPSPSRHGMNAKKHTNNMAVIPWSPLMSHLMYHFWYPFLSTLGDHNSLKANPPPFNARLGGKHITRFTSNPLKGHNHWKKDGGDVKIIDLEISLDPQQGISDSTSSGKPDPSSSKMHPFLSLLRWKANRGKEMSHEESEKQKIDNGFIQAHLDSSMVDKKGQSEKNDGSKTATHRPEMLSTTTIGVKQLEAKKLDPLGKDAFATDKTTEKPHVLGSQLQGRKPNYPVYEHLRDLLKPFASLKFPNDLEKYAGKLNDFSGLSNMLKKSVEVKKNDGDGETAKQTKVDNHGHEFTVEKNDGHTASRDEEEGKNEDIAKDVQTITEEFAPPEKNGGSSSLMPHAGNDISESNSVKPDGRSIKKSVKSKKSHMNTKIGNFPEDPSVKNEIMFEKDDNNRQNEATLIDNKPHGKEKGQRYQDPFISLKSRLRSKAIYPQDSSVLKQEQDNARHVNDDRKAFLATTLNNQRLGKMREVFGDDGKGGEVKTASRKRSLSITDKSITKDEGEGIKRPAAKDDTNFDANVVKNSYGNDAIGNLYHNDDDNDNERSVLQKVRSNPGHHVYRSKRAAVARKNGSEIEDAHQEKSKHDAEAVDKPIRDNSIVSDKTPTQHGPKETTVNEVKNDKGLRPNNEGKANPGSRPQSQQNESPVNLFHEKKKEDDSDKSYREPLPRPTPTITTTTSTTTKKEEPKMGGELFELYTAYKPVNKTEIRRQKREKAQHVVLGILTIGIFVCLLVSLICTMNCAREADPSLQRINSRTAIYMPHDHY